MTKYEIIIYWSPAAASPSPELSARFPTRKAWSLP